MANREAIERLEALIDTLEGMIFYCKDFEPKNDTSRYEQDIECYKMAIAALEKQEAVKPKGIRQLDTGSKYGTCPRCNFHFVRWPVNYCKSCGQKLGWEEDAE